MKVALIHDPLYKLGGAERVLDTLHELYPDAPLYTPIYDEVGTRGVYKDWDIRTSFLQQMPGKIWLINFYRALMPLAVEQWDLSEYDLIISSVTSVAKGVLTRQDALHFSYFHNITRFAWGDLEEHIAGVGFSVTAWPARSTLSKFRQWDFLAADRPDIIVANSKNVADRIKKYYRRIVSDIIYPPVDVERFTPQKVIGDYFLIISRLEPHKKVDIAVHAFNELGLPLKIVGVGPHEGYLRSIAKKNIAFMGRVSDTEVAKLLAGCQAFLYPQEEDFGITAVEAMAAGRPVIAYKKGGATETVVEGVTGTFFSEQTVESLQQAVASFEPERYTSSRITAHAKRFDRESFKKQLEHAIERAHHGT